MIENRISCIDESLVRLSSSSESVSWESPTIMHGGTTTGSSSTSQPPITTTNTTTIQNQNHPSLSHIILPTCPSTTTPAAITTTTTTNNNSTTTTGSAAAAIAFTASSSPSPFSFSSSSLDDITKLYAPITLEKQFQDLYRLFRPALIPKIITILQKQQQQQEEEQNNNVISSSQHHHEQQSSKAITNGNSSTSSTSNNLTNASAFIQGPRGSGKSLLVRQVLQAIMDEVHQATTATLKQPQHQQPSSSNLYFRHVYINGLLTPGHSVHTVVQEILYQLIHNNNHQRHQQQRTWKRPKMDDGGCQDVNKLDNNKCNIDNDAIKYKNDTTAHGNELSSSSPEQQQHQQPSQQPYVDILQELQLQSKQKHNFTNQLQLLNEIIEVASLDQIPILFILDELDTFLSTSSSAVSSSNNSRDHQNNPTGNGSNNNNNSNSNFVFHTERQLLLYHLLERITTPNSCCNFIGVSSDSTIMMKLEKRIKSRAEGISKFIITPSIRGNTYEQYVVPVLCHCIVDDNNHNNNNNKINDNDSQNDNRAIEPTLTLSLKQEVMKLLLPPVPVLNNNDENYGSCRQDYGTKQQQQQQIYETLQRNYNLGKDIRWFTRILYISLSLYRTDLFLALCNSTHNTKKKNSNRLLQIDDDKDVVDSILLSPSSIPEFHIKYIEEAMIDMGASFVKDMNATDPTTTHTVPESDIRLQTLRDLSGPQLTLVLSARRILYRDSCMQPHRNNNINQNQYNEIPTTSTSEYNIQQLTFRRMINEYQTSYKGQTSKYSSRILQLSFIELLRIGVFRPSIDHSGSIPFQYQFRDAFIYHNNNKDVMERLPLHMTLDIHYEIKYAIDNNLLLNCSTALREWGRKIN